MQHFVLDVEDELFTLRERFDYVLIGGDNADAPISEETAEELARTLLELGVSAILQLNDLGLTGQRRVIARFLTGLMKAPRQLWHPVLVTLDEAHRYAPQNSVVESRNRSLILLHQDASEDLERCLRRSAFRSYQNTSWANAPTASWGGQTNRSTVALPPIRLVLSVSPEAKHLMRLAHEFWVVGPAFAPEPRLIRFSAVVTTHLIAGHDKVPSPPTPEKVRALLGRLTRIAAQPKTEPPRNVPPERQRSPPPMDTAALQQAELQGYQRGFKEGETSGRAAANRYYSTEIAHIAEELSRLQNAAQRDASTSPELTAPRSLAPKKARTASDGASAPSGSLPPAGAMQLLETAVAHWPVCFTWGQLATLNGRKARGGYFNTSRKFLAEDGLVVERDGKGEPTDAAFRKTGAPRKQTPVTRDAKLGMWVTALPSPARDILQIVRVTPRPNRDQ